MKLCMVYTLDDNKLRSDSYCSIFRNMFDALIKRFDSIQHINNNCSAQDIDADIVFFFDPHATHHIQIDGIEKHDAIKMSYWNDMHQKEVEGIYKSSGKRIHKLGREQRAQRARDRGIDYIVTSVKYAFFEYFNQYFGNDISRLLLYFPHAPAFQKVFIPFNMRKHKVLGSGATWGAKEMKSYNFRKWAFQQPYIYQIDHCVHNDKVPKGKDYIKFLSHFTGVLALSSPFPVPKYMEVPFAGCVTFAEYHKEYEELGFRDMESCIYVNKQNFKERIMEFLNSKDLSSYRDIANQGRMLVEQNYTAKHFADFIYRKAEEVLCHIIQPQQQKELLGSL